MVSTRVVCGVVLTQYSEIISDMTEEECEKRPDTKQLLEVKVISYCIC